MNTLSRLRTAPRLALLGAAIALTFASAPAFAQEMDHSQMQMPPATPPAKKPAAKKPAPKKPASAPAAPKQPTDPHAGHVMPAPKPAAVDHGAMGHGTPAAPKPAPKKPAAKTPAADPHAGHAMPAPKAEPAPAAVDHAAMGHEMPMPAPSDQAKPMDHASMPGMTTPAPIEPITPIPPITDADRAAAVPPAIGHALHDNSIKSFVLLDRLEGWNADNGRGLAWKEVGWVGTDLNRLWIRSEGEREGGRNEKADIELLYGRSIATWWDVVAGVRQDFAPGSSQTFAAFGVQGLAPYKYEVEATAYVSESGQTAARLEAEYDTLLTNRLILQWQAEAELYGQDDERRGIGSGLSTIEAGLRLRYEIRREFAPYLGVAWERAYGGTADFRRGEGEDINDTRLVAGLRIWF